MGTQSASEQPIAIGYREDVFACHAKGRQTASHTLAPDTDILARVAHDSRVSRSAAGGMHTDNLALRSRLQAERIIVTQILLRGKGQFGDVLDGLDIIGEDVQFLQLVTIERHVVIDVLHDVMQSFTLKLAHLIVAQALHCRIINHTRSVHNTLFIIPHQGCPNSTGSLVVLQSDSPRISASAHQAARTDGLR